MNQADATVALTPNATHPVWREAAWFRVTPPHMQTLGIVEVRECRTPTSVPHLRRYALLELESSEGGREFKFTKSEGKEKYHAFIADRGHDQCECHGHQTVRGGLCVHLEVLRKLIAGGHLPDRRAAPGGSGGPEARPDKPETAVG